MKRMNMKRMGILVTFAVASALGGCVQATETDEPIGQDQSGVDSVAAIEGNRVELPSEALDQRGVTPVETDVPAGQDPSSLDIGLAREDLDPASEKVYGTPLMEPQSQCVMKACMNYGIPLVPYWMCNCSCLPDCAGTSFHVDKAFCREEGACAALCAKTSMSDCPEASGT